MEYPLPKSAGVRDYIFCFEPNRDDYIKTAHEFLSRIYPDHVHVRNVVHLSKIINRLHADIT